MSNGWTGGQYSLYRYIFGLYLFIHFFQLLPWGGDLFSNRGMISNGNLSPLIHLFPNILAINDSPLLVVALNLCGVAASLFFMVGKWDRSAAVTLWYILACFLGRNPLIANPSLPFVGWLLLAHVLLPGAPYGSLRARKRVDPNGKWSMTPSVFLAAWIVMSVAYTYSGILKLYSPSWVDGSAFSHLLHNPLIRCNASREILMVFPAFILKAMTWGALALEISFAFLVLFKKLRPWVWTAMLLMHVGLLFLINFADLTWGMIMVHFFTFDPGWIKPRPVVGKLAVFYDGSCGFCHSFIRFVLAENRGRMPFRFAPLDSRFSAASMPNSIVVEDNERLLFKSEAVFRVLASLGGVWKILALLLSAVPTTLSDWIYDLVARVRHRIFAKPKESCPIIPVEMREFFGD